jgi:hypothetical protein
MPKNPWRHKERPGSALESIAITAALACRWLAAAGLMLAIAASACSSPTPPPTPAPPATPLPSPISEIECIPWYDVSEHLGETTCVEGRIYKVRVANAPRFAFFLFDPSYTDIDHCCGKFHAWVRSDDWCEYFSDCRRGPTISSELNGACAHVFGAVEKNMGRVRIAVTDRSQLEFVECAACQVPEACAPHP